VAPDRAVQVSSGAPRPRKLRRVGENNVSGQRRALVSSAGAVFFFAIENAAATRGPNRATV
jgi:hypothetical protein